MGCVINNSLRRMTFCCSLECAWILYPCPTRMLYPIQIVGSCENREHDGQLYQFHLWTGPISCSFLFNCLKWILQHISSICMFPFKIMSTFQIKLRSSLTPSWPLPDSPKITSAASFNVNACRFFFKYYFKNTYVIPIGKCIGLGWWEGFTQKTSFSQ